MNLETQQKVLETLSLISTAQEYTHYPWTEDDLRHAVLIMASIAVSLSTRHFDGKLTIDQERVVAREFADNIRQSIELFTGIDLSDSDAVLEAEEIS